MPESLHKEFPVDSDLHKKILKAVIDRKLYSQGKMRVHYGRWNKADEDMAGYIPISQADSARQSKRDSQGKMDYVTLEVPYTYAIIASLHTYVSSVFLSRTPIYQVSARHGEGQDSVMAIEAAMDYQRQVAAHVPYLYHWFWDGCKYGIGIIGEYWDEQILRVARIVEKEKKLLGVIGTGKTEKVRQIFEEIGYQGNRLYNIRPFDFFPDPRVPLYDFQNGEFCGRQVQVGLSYLQCEEYYKKYFNIDMLVKTKGGMEGLDRYTSADISTDLESSSSRVDRPYGSFDGTEATAGKGFVTLLEMVVRINPAEWELGEKGKPEKWVFTVANERVVIGCRPLGLFHDRFPYSILETGFGSEAFIKDNTADHIRPLAQTLSWLFNTHMYNVRKAINDVRVVDPSKIVMKDAQRPQAGGIIRLKPQFYGGDVRTAILQLQAQDVTINHLRDSQVVEQLIQRVGGINDNVMGIVAEGGRRTATETRAATGFSINRAKTISEYFSAIGFSDLTGRMINNTQGLMTIERKFAIAGSMLGDAKTFVMVTPEALAGAYDFVPVDGTLPIDRLAQANFWKELLIQLGRNPQLAMQWDLGGMLAHAMMLQGERNVNRFKINVLPPGAAPGSTLPGNVVPIGGQGGRGGTQGAPGGAGSATTTY